MGQDIMLDAAFPPSPLQWVTDMGNVGATVGAIYTYGPFTNYTPAHVSQASASSKRVLPIVVPGSNPPDPRLVLASVGRYGITSGPVAKDREAGSLYPSDWSQAFDTIARQSGYVPIDYANLNDAIVPAELDDRWLAEWLRTGVMNPVPTLPSGLVAWQFVNDVTIGASQYDISVIVDWLWTPPPTKSPIGVAMSSNIILPDPTINGALWRVAHEDVTGHVWWGLHEGGEGGEDTNAWINNLSTDNPPASGPVVLAVGTVGAAVHLFQGVKRIVVSGRNVADDATWQVTVKAQDDFAIIEPWHAIPLNVKLAVSPAGPKGDSGADTVLRGILRGIPAS
jgi:hypothetical protein